MLTAVQRENIATIFDALDLTGDGLITREDAVLTADTLCAGMGVDDGSAAHAEIQAAYRQLWDELMRFADANDDGAVDMDEFLAAVDRGMLADEGFVESAMLVVSHNMSTITERTTAYFPASQVSGGSFLILRSSSAPNASAALPNCAPAAA